MRLRYSTHLIVYKIYKKIRVISLLSLMVEVCRMLNFSLHHKMNYWYWVVQSKIMGVQILTNQFGKRAQIFAKWQRCSFPIELVRNFFWEFFSILFCFSTKFFCFDLNSFVVVINRDYPYLKGINESNQKYQPTLVTGFVVFEKEFDSIYLVAVKNNWCKT